MDVIGRIFAMLLDPEQYNQGEIEQLLKWEHGILCEYVEAKIRSQESLPENPKMSDTFLTTAMHVYSKRQIFEDHIGSIPPSIALARASMELFMESSTDLPDTPTTRRFVECGVQLYFHTQKVQEPMILLLVFSASLKTCTLLWNQLLKEEKNADLSQPQLLTRLCDCQNLCVMVFNRASECLKETIASDNGGSIIFALKLSIIFLQGM